MKIIWPKFQIIVHNNSKDIFIQNIRWPVEGNRRSAMRVDIMDGKNYHIKQNVLVFKIFFSWLLYQSVWTMSMPSHGERAMYVFILNLMLFCVLRRSACLGTVPVPAHINFVLSCPHFICLSHCFNVHMSSEFYPIRASMLCLG